MKKICTTHTLSLYSSKQLEEYLGGMRIGIFDIETLGLNPTTSPMILAGFMSMDGENQYTITQYFAQTPDEEIEIINQLKEDFKKVDYLLTFNGKHFDMPFVSKRAYNNTVFDIETNLYNLDLYLILNGHSEVKHVLENLKQKTVEKYMGLSDGREDAISGAESIMLYETYLHCKDQKKKQDLEDKILLHNHDDLLQLAQILPIVKQANIHKAFYSLGFPILGQSGWPTLNVSSIKQSVTGLNVKGTYYGAPFSYAAFETVQSPFSCEFKDDKTFNFSLHTDKHKGNVFINLPTYFDNHDELKKYPNYIKNFLLISDSKSVNHLEVNMFLKMFFTKFMEDSICPLMTL